MLQVDSRCISHKLDCVNWPEDFPYRPETLFDLSHSGDEMHLHFAVREDAVRAVLSSDRDHVCEDSCAEFFFAPFEDGLYYNIECSCIGTLSICCGRGRSDRQELPLRAYESVRRRSTLGSAPLGLIDHPLEWELWLDIPASVFTFHDIKSFSGLHSSGNFYKCGDKLPVPHYLTWAPVRTPKPDFHRPEFFDTINFV